MLPLLPLLLSAQIPGATIFDASLLLRYTATQGEPQTWFTGENDAESLLLPRPFHDYPAALLLLWLETEVEPGVSLRLLLDSGQLRSGQSLEPPLELGLTSDGESLSSALFNLERVKELAVAVSWDHGSFEAGRRVAAIGESMIFEDFSTGVALSLDLGSLGLEDWSLTAGGLVVGYDWEALAQPNPLLHLRVGRELSWLEAVGVFGALFVENGLLQEPLFSVWSEGVIAAAGSSAQTELDELFVSERTSHGYLAYAGVDASLLPAAGWSVRGVALVAAGEVSIDNPEVDFSIVSWAANAEVSYGLTPNLGVGGFLVAMAGDQPPTNPGRVDYQGFVAISPYWTWTGLFFSGGLTQGLYPGRASAAGVNGHGVFAGGARGELTYDDFWAEARLAGLWALAPPLGDDSLLYGFEADLVVEWQPLEWLGAAVELDTLYAGDFFPERDIAFRAIGQIHGRLGD